MNNQQIVEKIRIFSTTFSSLVVRVVEAMATAMTKQPRQESVHQTFRIR